MKIRIIREGIGRKKPQPEPEAPEARHPSGIEGLPSWFRKGKFLSLNDASQLMRKIFGDKGATHMFEHDHPSGPAATVLWPDQGGRLPIKFVASTSGDHGFEYSDETVVPGRSVTDEQAKQFGFSNVFYYIPPWANK